MVCKKTCTSSHKMDQSLWQKRLARLISYIHDTSDVEQNLVMWENPHNSADWDCFRTLTLPETLKTQKRLWVESCESLDVTCFVPIHQLDVEETNFGLTQFDGIWNYVSWSRFTHGWNSRSWSLGFGYWMKCCILPSTKQRNPKK